MIKVLYMDSDKVMLETMTKYLSWYGISVRVETDPLSIIPAIKEFMPSLVILSEEIAGGDAYGLSRMIRGADDPKVSSSKILIVSQDEPDIDKFMVVEELDINFMNKYENVQVWVNKINMVRKGQ